MFATRWKSDMAESKSTGVILSVCESYQMHKLFRLGVPKSSFGMKSLFSIQVSLMSVE